MKRTVYNQISGLHIQFFKGVKDTHCKRSPVEEKMMGCIIIIPKIAIKIQFSNCGHKRRSVLNDNKTIYKIF